MKKIIIILINIITFIKIMYHPLFFFFFKNIIIFTGYKYNITILQIHIENFPEYKKNNNTLYPFSLKKWVSRLLNLVLYFSVRQLKINNFKQ